MILPSPHILKNDVRVGPSLTKLPRSMHDIQHASTTVLRWYGALMRGSRKFFQRESNFFFFLIRGEIPL